MTNILYFGSRPKASLSRTLAVAGYRIVSVRYTEGVLRKAAASAVVLNWRSRNGQQVIKEAREQGLPVLVITSRLAEAVDAGESADLYLEQPATDEEISSLVIEMITSKMPERAGAAGTSR